MTLRRVLPIVLIGLMLLASSGGVFAQDASPSSPANLQAANGPGFPYDGRLFNGGAGVTGTCDFEFSLWNAASGGGQVGGTHTVSGVIVTAGLFSATVNSGAQFGPTAYNGDARWLAIAVRCPTNTGGFTPLTPRQALSPTPYAHCALVAGSASAAPWSGITGIPAGFADGTDDVGGGGASWQLTGNGALASDFLGTTNDTTLTIRVSNTVALRLAPTAGTPNVLGGNIGNLAYSGVEGATIGGGGNVIFGGNTITASYAVIGGGAGNVAAYFATVGGGLDNVANDNYATVSGGTLNSAGLLAAIGGGQHNDASGAWSAIAGGSENTTSGNYAAIGGGFTNTVSGHYSTVGGGRNNTAGYDLATVSGGDHNYAGVASVVAGGNNNVATGGRGVVGGGGYNTNYGGFSTIAGGYGNDIGFDVVYAAIGGGDNNYASDSAVTISGGAENWGGAEGATIGGGFSNQASHLYATVGGGYDNQASYDYATVGGGYQNFATGMYAALIGGSGNFATGAYATIGGGFDNLAQGEDSTVAGGLSNSANNTDTTVGGGSDNTAGGTAATVAGGQNNIAGGNYATVPGGIDNRASGDGSVAMGSHTRAAHSGSFIFADVASSNVISTTGLNQFVVRAAGGYFLYTNSGLSNGCLLAAGGGSWSCGSDRNNKANFGAVDGVAVLNTLISLPIETWNYTTQDTAIRHMGPMAQDWYAAFGLGEGETTITGVDADGVALAAIQGLYTVVQEKEAALAAQQVEIAALRESNAALAEEQAETNERLAALEARAVLRGDVAPDNNSLQLLTVLVIGLAAGAGLCLAAFALGRRPARSG